MQLLWILTFSHLCCGAGERVAVAKVQVGLLGSARSLQRQLDRLASRADTTTPSGLHYVLQGLGVFDCQGLGFPLVSLQLPACAAGKQAQLCMA